MSGSLNPWTNKIPKLIRGAIIKLKKAFKFLDFIIKNKTTNAYKRKSYLFAMQNPAKNELIQRSDGFLLSLYFKRKNNENKKAISPYNTAQEYGKW